MVTIEDELTKEELVRARKFLDGLKYPDKRNVERIIYSIDYVACDYFNSGEQNDNWRSFVEEGRVGKAFFSVYLIGGCLNKNGKRPDIDLLVATNMRWREGFLYPDFYSERPSILEPGDLDPIWVKLVSEFRGEYSIKKHGELPDDYNVGVTKGKVLITISPKNGRKIDISYVRSWPDPRFRFIDEEQFHKLDVGGNREQLPRLPLYRKTSDIRTPGISR